MGRSIVVCTFSAANNFGAVLQCYGLVKVLGEIAPNTDIQVYSDENDIFKNVYRLIYKPTSVKSALKMTLNYLPRRKCKKKFDQFRNKFFQMTTQANYKDWKLFICGSDQVWNPQYVRDKSPYWGDVDMPQKCICASYAASLGVSVLNEAEKRMLFEKLKNFDYISVREESGKQIIEQFTDKNVLQHCDPVLLPQRKVWEDLAKKNRKQNSGNYVLIFSLSRRDFVKSIATNYAEENGFKVIEIYLAEKNMETIFRRDQRNDVGPLDFLSLIYNAECIFTSSFHCSLFAMIFHKRFYTIPHETTGSRIIDLMKKYHLEDQIINAPNQILPQKDIDYTFFEEESSRDRNKAIDYLYNLIGECDEKNSN